MPALTEARYEALRCARAAARLVLAKHRSVTLGGVCVRSVEAVSMGLRPDGDRCLIAHEGQDVGGGRNSAGADGSK